MSGIWQAFRNEMSTAFAGVTLTASFARSGSNIAATVGFVPERNVTVCRRAVDAHRWHRSESVVCAHQRPLISAARPWTALRPDRTMRAVAALLLSARQRNSTRRVRCLRLSAAGGVVLAAALIFGVCAAHAAAPEPLSPPDGHTATMAFSGLGQPEAVVKVASTLAGGSDCYGGKLLWVGPAPAVDANGVMVNGTYDSSFFGYSAAEGLCTATLRRPVGTTLYWQITTTECQGTTCRRVGSVPRRLSFALEPAAAPVLTVPAVATAGGRLRVTVRDAAASALRVRVSSVAPGADGALAATADEREVRRALDSFANEDMFAVTVTLPKRRGRVWVQAVRTGCVNHNADPACLAAAQSSAAALMLRLPAARLRLSGRRFVFRGFAPIRVSCPGVPCRATVTARLAGARVGRRSVAITSASKLIKVRLSPSAARRVRSGLGRRGVPVSMSVIATDAYA